MPVTEARTTFMSGGKAVAVETYGRGAASPGPAVLMLHGADGLSGRPQYREGARAIAAAGYRVHLVHYLDRTEERRASFGTLFRNFGAWAETTRDALGFAAAQPGADPGRIGLVGISLGAALGLAVASGDRRIKALVTYFGPLPHGAIGADARLPPTLVLHGTADPIVPVANAHAVEALLRRQNVPHEIKLYPGQGHGFTGEAHRDASRRALAFLDRHLAERRASVATEPPTARS